MRCPYRPGLLLVLLCVLTVVPWSPADAKMGSSLVVGGIEPCTGLPPSMVKNLPHYAAGTVLTVEGRLKRGPSGGVTLPRHVVARETVRVNATYRFALTPGPYVLTARLPHSNVQPFVQVTVRQGVTVHANIPNMCM